MPARFNLRLGVLCCLALAWSAGRGLADPPAEKTAVKPAVNLQKSSGGSVPDELRLLSETISDAEVSGNFAAALEAAKRSASLIASWDKSQPWEVLDAQRRVATLTNLVGWTEVEQTVWRAIRAKQILAGQLFSQGKYEAAEPIFKEILEYFQKLEGKPDRADVVSLAQSYSNAGLNLYLQARFADAQALFDAALSARRKHLGEDHPDTAASYQNCGENLRAQGKYPQSQTLFETAVAIQRKVRGEAHPETATAYNSLALCLAGQGRFAEARPLYENALAILSQTRGPAHRDTATASSNLAANLSAQGRYADAQPLFEKALAIFLQQQNPQNRDTATAYNNLATVLRSQGRHAEAQPYFEKALALRILVLGKSHADTGQSHYNLAVSLSDQERYGEAQSHFEQALAIFRDRLTNQHVDTAICYLKLAGNLENQGHFQDARKYLEQTLAIRRNAFGEHHPDTAQAYHELALNSYYQADYEAADELWSRAADSFERVRLLIALSGLDRAVKTGEQSPLLFLAGLRARRGQPEAAWARWESSLARGLLDDLAARPAGKLTPADQQREQEIRAEIRRVEVIRAVVNVQTLDQSERDKQQELLQTEQLALQAKLSEFEEYLAKTYAVAQGQNYGLARIQKALTPETALVSWLDIPGHPRATDPQGEHWGVVIRKQGPPVWVKLPGTGEAAAWTADDDQLGQQLAGVLANPAGRPLRHTAGQIRQLVKELKAQRIEPLESCFAARDGMPDVTRLIFLPAPAMRAVPIEMLLPDQFTVSYVPSGTLLTWLVESQRDLPHGAGASQRGLLAVGDPIFTRHPVPEGGVFLNTVSQTGLAQKAGLRSGDVLLSYAGRRLNNAEDLRAALAGIEAGKQSAAIVFWRQGETFQQEIPLGKLGVGYLPESATEIVRSRRGTDRSASTTRESFQQLPGTRLEVQTIARTFGTAKLPAQILLGTDASESRLAELSGADQLRQFRFIHFATHGVPDSERPMRSRIILSRNNLPDPRQQLLSGKPVFRGELTAEQVLNEWKLNADLVALSACQSGLGQYAVGEGHLGFAQALLLSGARSLLLSLWKVDDSATALLMARFYENVLGTRPGASGPLTKAAALHEAKVWLRQLTAAQVATLMNEKVSGQASALAPPTGEEGATRPFEHPVYWAAFVLIGSPD